MSSPLLSVASLIAGYDADVPIINDVSFAVEAGKALAVIGPNGAGKSTLLKALLGLVPNVTGEVRFADVLLPRLSPGPLVRAGIGFVPQGHQVFPEMTVGENLEMGCYWMKAAGAQAAVERVLARLPILREFATRQAGVLSGGEQQLVSIGRALTLQPKVLLIDEPSAGLSPRNTLMVFEILGELRRAGLTIVLVEQNAVMALKFADHGLVLDMGRKRFHGLAAELVRDPDVRALYLGGA